MRRVIAEQDCRFISAQPESPPPVGLRPGAVLGRIGGLEVRLAASAEEVVEAQELRFRVFQRETGPRGGVSDLQQQRDADRFDEVCDHLLVADTGSGSPRTVGTYRLLRQDRAPAAGGFYSSEEFELDRLAARHPGLRFLELGRSCVLPEYRSKRTIELLWQGIWAYVRHYRLDVMTGCASFSGTVPAAHAEALSFLAHNCTAKGEWATRAVAARFHPMDLMPREAVDPRRSLVALPPLVKGYLRLGARIGEGCVVDHDFGTTDVFVVMPVAAICSRYINYYGSDAQRFAA